MAGMSRRSTRRRRKPASALPPAEEYPDRPLDPEPSLCLSRESRVHVYSRPVAQKRAVFHPGDLVSPGRAQDREDLPASMTR